MNGGRAMRVVNSIKELEEIMGPLHLALGVFDGVHIGHQAVIAEAVSAAKHRGCEQGGLVGVLTFDPHPIQVLAPEVAPQRILASLEHKQELLSDLGVDLLVVVPFTKEFAQVQAGEFLNELIAACPELKTVSMGRDWKFGSGRGGDVKLLEKFGKENGITVRPVDAVMLDGERVSSTRIRQAIRDGNLTAASAMLGREYEVLGTVVHGRKLGRQLGFPTANLRVHNEQLPPDGVWAVRVALDDGSRHLGAGNLGMRPTVEGEEARRLLEVYLLDFQGDLYGQNIEVKFLSYVREERKFNSVDELRAQIELDVEMCKNSSV